MDDAVADQLVSALAGSNAGSSSVKLSAWGILTNLVMPLTKCVPAEYPCAHWKD